MTTTGGGNTDFNAPDIAQQMLNFGLPPQEAIASQEHRGPKPPHPRPSDDMVTAAGLFPDSLSDRGNAKLFVSLYGKDYRYVPGLGWYRWTGYRWQLDETDTIVWSSGEMAEKLAVADPRGVYSTTELRRHRKRALATSGITAMLTQAKAHPDMNLSPARLDADPYALCTPGGVVDLHTGYLEPSNPSHHFHSRSTTLAPRPMPIPRWQRFLDDTFGDDADGKQTIDFLHLLLGHSITGDVGAQVLPFLFGLGKNGKSVLLEVMLELLGDYADAAPPGFLMAKTFEGHPTDLADLHGRRIIVCSELKPGDRFDEARVKLLTGGDTIKARRMRQDFFSFRPTHHLWLLGNHRPEVSTGDPAFWRRIRLIPFTRTVPEESKIDNLAQLLVAEEGPGILLWLVDGARRYLAGEKDVTGPENVRVATTAYAETEDHVGRFLASECKIDLNDRNLKTEQGQLFAAYAHWCSAEGSAPVTARTFAARVRDAIGLSSPSQMATSNSRKFYPRIGLINLHSEGPQQ